jgi:hypothetical protein
MITSEQADQVILSLPFDLRHQVLIYVEEIDQNASKMNNGKNFGN